MGNRHPWSFNIRNANGMQDEVIHDLIARSFTEQLSEEEGLILSTWRQADELHENRYQELKRIWELSLGLKPMYTPDTDKKWRDLLMEMESEPRTGRVLSLLGGSLFYKIAASIILVTSMVYAMAYFSGHILKETVERQTASEMDIFYLPDSSVVWLNKNSTLTYSKDFDGDERVVYLEGEAFFDVVKNPNKPFIIHAEGTTTKVLGTSFDLKAYKDAQEVSLTVMTGKVEFSAHDQTLLLLPEETGIYLKSNQGLTLRTKSIEEKEVAWMKDENVYKHNDVYQMESTHPEKYVQNTFEARTNLINQTVIEGEIKNAAKLCSYSQIHLKVVYISKKNKVYEYRFMIKNKVNPGEKVAYKQKLPDWFVDTEEIKLFLEKVEGLNFK